MQPTQPIESIHATFQAAAPIASSANKTAAPQPSKPDSKPKPGSKIWIWVIVGVAVLGVVGAVVYMVMRKKKGPESDNNNGQDDTKAKEEADAKAAEEEEAAAKAQEEAEAQRQKNVASLSDAKRAEIQASLRAQMEAARQKDIDIPQPAPTSSKPHPTDASVLDHTGPTTGPPAPLSTSVAKPAAK